MPGPRFSEANTQKRVARQGRRALSAGKRTRVPSGRPSRYRSAKSSMPLLQDRELRIILDFAISIGLPRLFLKSDDRIVPSAHRVAHGRTAAGPERPPRIFQEFQGQSFGRQSNSGTS